MDKNITSKSIEITLNRPWIRLFARLIDYFIFAYIFIYIWDSLKLHRPVFTIFLDLLMMFIWIFVEALLLTLIGTTPGKWLLNTYIKDKEGRKLTYMKALLRSYSVWWNGMGIGIPFLTVLLGTINYNILVNDHITKWDYWFGSKIIHKKVGILRALLLIILISVYLFL